MARPKKEQPKRKPKRRKKGRAKPRRKVVWPPRDRPQELTRDQMPKSLLKQKTVPLCQHNPLEFEALASRIPQTRPLPEGITERKRKLLMRLRMYKGYTPEGWRDTVSRIPRKVKDMVEYGKKGAEPQLPANVTPPVIPTMALPPDLKQVELEKTTRGKYLKATLSREEYDLYKQTWITWMTGHPEYMTQPEHMEDVDTICMETVRIFRYELLQQRNPKKDYQAKINSARHMILTARRNLQATLSQQMKNNPKPKGRIGTVNVFNAPVQQNSMVSMEDRVKQAQALAADEMKFLEETTSAPVDTSFLQSVQDQQAAEEQKKQG